MTGHYSVQRLRRGIGHFLWGKASSALLSFAGLLLVARLLDAGEFGTYVAMLALVELALNLSSFGFDWISTRYVPEYRVQAGGRLLARFVARLVLIQALLLAIVSVSLGFFAEPIATLVGVANAAPALRLYAVYMFVEGLSRILRDQMLGQLLLQGRAQIALVLRHLVWVGACVMLLADSRQTSVETIALIELLAAALGLTIAAVGLAFALRSAWQEVDHAVETDWKPPTGHQLWSLAANSYLSFLLNIPARAQVLTLLVTRLAGVESAAVYGFARSLADQVLRFLPAELLLSFVRPALVARYVSTRDLAALNSQVNVLLTVSLLVLAPLLALVFSHGQLVVHVLGGGRFEGSAPVLAWMLLVAVLFSHRRMLEFLANTVGCPQAISRGSAVMLLVPVAAFALLLSGLPIWTVPMAAGIGELLFAGVAIVALRRSGIGYAAPLGAAVRIFVATGLASLVALALPIPVPHTWASLLGHGFVALLLTAACVCLSRPLDTEAVSLLKALVKLKRG